MKENTKTALYFSTALIFAIYSVKFHQESKIPFLIVMTGLYPWLSAFCLFKAIRRVLDGREKR